MRTSAIYNLVFNRKKQKLLPGDKSLVQIEVLLPGTHKKYIGTNIYLQESEWDVRTRQVINTGNDVFFNKQLSDFVNKLRKLEMTVNDAGRIITTSDLEQFLNSGTAVGSFYEFMKQEATKRNDITVKTRQSHILAAEHLKTNGIVMFSDLTYSNIVAYDQALRAENKVQTTIHKYHKNLKTYIHLAEKSGLIEYGHNPYLKFSVPHGKHAIRERLDDAEIELLSKKEILDPAISLSRDLFLFSVYTGMAYKDVQGLTSSNLREIDGKLWIEGLRKKSGEYYTVYLLPKAVKLIDHYRSGDKIFPTPELHHQNRLLKVVAAACGINKQLTTHIGRHTCATLMLREDVSLKVISEMLGHSQIATTEIYAKLEKQTMRKELDRMNDKTTPQDPGKKV
jgi:site-specific recombinase XerD